MGSSGTCMSRRRWSGPSQAQSEGGSSSRSPPWNSWGVELGSLEMCLARVRALGRRVSRRGRRRQSSGLGLWHGLGRRWRRCVGYGTGWCGRMRISMEKTDWACPRWRNSYKLRMLESGGGMSGMAERDAADDVGAIDGGGVPGVDGAVDCFDGDLGVAGALCNGDGDGLVEEPEEPLDDDGFVVPWEGWLAGQVEGCAHGFEVAKEGGAQSRCGGGLVLWFPRRAGWQGRLRAVHMALKWPRKGEPASRATRRQKPTRRRTGFMNAAASVAESRAMTSVMMEKPVRLHMAARKYWEPSYAGMAPGCQMSTWMMANGDETGGCRKKIRA
eukprot:scaffold6199_cov167-Amphora_coffeaeformis.AAC.2